jgi:hypothetical protein
MSDLSQIPVVILSGGPRSGVSTCAAYLEDTYGFATHRLVGCGTASPRVECDDDVDAACSAYGAKWRALMNGRHAARVAVLSHAARPLRTGFGPLRIHIIRGPGPFDTSNTYHNGWLVYNDHNCIGSFDKFFACVDIAVKSAAFVAPDDAPVPAPAPARSSHSSR